MRINNKSKSFLGCLLLMATLFAVMSSTASASVTFTEEKEADRKYIGVTGNPDFYPYESYNEETGEYEGVFPALFALLSEKSGLDFEYVDCGAMDQRLVDEKTGYAQIISAYIMDEEEMEDYLITNAVPVVDYEVEGKTVSICFAFGKYAEEDTIQKVTAAMESVTDDEITSLLGKYINAKSSRGDVTRYIMVIVLLLGVIVLCGFIMTNMIMKQGIDKRKLQKKQMIDSLTGIGNKAYFEEEFGKLIAYQYKASYVMAYIGFDIKRVNKYYGEESAEQQLCYAAHLLTTDGKRKEIAARVTGGAFGVLHVCSSETEAKDWAGELISRLNVFTSRYDKDYKPKFKAGVYRLQSGNWDYEKAMKNAQRCYDIAVEKEADVFVSTEAMEQEIKRNEILSHDVAGAFDRREFVQFLQPIVLAENGKIFGAEGLARWRHPKFGLLYPGRFVQMMLDEGKAIDFDMYLFEESCKKLEKWKKEGKDYRISTNFTRMSISSLDYMDRVRMIAAKYDFDHSQLVVEITEDSLEDNEDIARSNMNAVKELGFRLALDDLGSGYTFFSDLKDYPLDLVKTDREMLLDAMDEKGKALMQGLIRVCKDMGMEIICEGVENEEQYELVKMMGCDYIQGYYFYKPMSAEDAAKYM